MNPENRKMSVIVLLSLLSSFQLLLLFSIASSFHELIFMLIIASFFLAISCLPYTLKSSITQSYYYRIAGSILLQGLSLLLNLY